MFWTFLIMSIIVVVISQKYLKKEKEVNGKETTTAVKGSCIH